MYTWEKALVQLLNQSTISVYTHHSELFKGIERSISTCLSRFARGTYV